MPAEIVSFNIGGQAFCLDIEHVLEIRGWNGTTTLPHAPDYVLGMMNLRGTVLPVLDLSMRLGLGRTDPGPRHVIIIARIARKSIGLLVDSVSNILTVSAEDMQPPPNLPSRQTAGFITGIFAIEDQIIHAINAHEILPEEDIEEQ